MSININRVTKKFSNNALNPNIVLQDISLDINDGDILAVVGRNGVGKTTLLNIIANRLGPDEGVVSYDSLLANSLAIVNMNERSFFWNLSVKNNLDFFSPGYENKKINNELIEIFHLNKIINSKYSSLSSGEKKKLMLFRSIVKGAKVLILDEFTNSLDLVSKDSTYKLLKKLIKNNFIKIIVFASHDINEVHSLANRCIAMKNGYISEDLKIDENISYSEIKKLMQ